MLNDSDDLENRCNKASILDSPAFQVVLEQTQPLVNQFCEKYNVTLLEVDFKFDGGIAKPFYVFSDHLGVYFTEALLDSL